MIPHKKVYMYGGYNTISMGTGRKEFNPKKARPGLEHYIKEAGQGTLAQIGGAANVDEGVIGNFMAARFNNQANLPGFLPMIDEGLSMKPGVSVEGACGVRRFGTSSRNQISAFRVSRGSFIARC